MTTDRAELLADPSAQAPAGFLVWVGELVHAHRAQLLAYARHRGLGAEDALDAVQDGFVQFLKLPQVRAVARTPDDAIKLLTVLVRHDALNRRRNRCEHPQETSLRCSGFLLATCESCCTELENVSEPAPSNELAKQGVFQMWTKTPLTEAIGIDLPIVQGPFGGGNSSPALAAAVSNAGGLVRSERSPCRPRRSSQSWSAKPKRFCARSGSVRVNTDSTVLDIQVEITK